MKNFYMKDCFLDLKIILLKTICKTKYKISITIFSVKYFMKIQSVEMNGFKAKL